MRAPQMTDTPCIMITGARGFVGQHLMTRLRERFGDRARVLPTARAADIPSGDEETYELDVTDEDAVAAAIAAMQPSHLIHLSALSAPADVQSDPRTAWDINTWGTHAVALGVLRSAPQCRLLFAGTGLVYGNSAALAAPFTEASLLAPAGDYAVTKAAADLLLGSLVRQGLRSIRYRLFNHTGAGQSERFVVPRFAAQIARIEAGLQPPRIDVGNLEAVRDMLDVRDVVEAYVLGIERSETLPPDTILNVSSGIPYKIGDILNQLLALSGAEIEISGNADFHAASPDDVLVGDSRLAERLLGWKPAWSLTQTLELVLDYWRERVRGEPAP